MDQSKEMLSLWLVQIEHGVKNRRRFLLESMHATVLASVSECQVLTVDVHALSNQTEGFFDSNGSRHWKEIH